jgi:hypothetical protein
MEIMPFALDALAAIAPLKYRISAFRKAVSNR